MKNASPFRPAWWCAGRHLQTIWGPLLRRNGTLPLRRERWETPDGDFLDLDWLDGPAGSPLIVILHGLEGSSQSHYVHGLLTEIRGFGWRGVALNFRSCSGELNRRPRFYHSGETSDLDWVVGRLLAREPAALLGLVGVSLGGNVLCKWLGERGADLAPRIAGAVAISTPFDLTACVGVMDRGLNRFLYTSNFVRSLQRKVRAKARILAEFIDLKAALGARTFGEYDRVVTAPLYGFLDERDYWLRASSMPYLSRIRRPTLLINAVNDPFVPASTLPAQAIAESEWLTALFSPQGGHAGFLAGRWPWRSFSWAERSAVAFLRSRLDSQATRPPSRTPGA